MSIFLGSLLALVLASCPILAPLAAAAASKQHACCPSQPDQAQGPDCCIRATASASTAFVAPHFVVIAIVGVEPAIAAGLEVFRLDSAALSPPEGPSLQSGSSRAPPSLLA